MSGTQKGTIILTTTHMHSASLKGIVVMHDRRMPQNGPSNQIVCQRLPQTDRGKRLQEHGAIIPSLKSLS